MGAYILHVAFKKQRICSVKTLVPSLFQSRSLLQCSWQFLTSVDLPLAVWTRSQYEFNKQASKCASVVTREPFITYVNLTELLLC